MPEEAITALRQNLAQPGKVIIVNSSSSNSLPYDGVSALLVIADSANNRYILCDALKQTYIESIGSGRVGYQNGSFKEAMFYHTQGLCHFINKEGQHCLLLCDVKNHCIREANLHTKVVRHVAGIPGVRGRDLQGGTQPAIS